MSASCVWGVVAEAEALGVRLRLVGDRVRVSLPGGEHERLAEILGRLRRERDAVAEVLRQRATIPAMPPGVRLLAWNLKEPPVAIESCAVVVDVPLFVKSTLEQVGAALVNPRRWVGWSVPQLLDRLEQVGVVVAVERPESDTA